ncbi:MAG: prepilin-type N-terminal cleavage/methylation domain-containing protein [Deltaproteobacteria bacterium]|nr:prepilin-type N-terminal cleavage/methylation domain-containing protein [Deltaproteobacteria bacterium]
MSLSRLGFAQKTSRRFSSSSAFTLIELVVVIIIIGLVFGVVGLRSGSFDFWKDEGFVRRLSETITFLHHQAVVDQAYYRMDFDLRKNTYRVRVVRPEDHEDDEKLSAIASDAGYLSLELAAFLNPSLGRGQTLIPPPSLPSLAEAQEFPSGMHIEDLRTMRGRSTPAQDESGYIVFSPRGFSEFAVLHLRLSTGQPVTILVNPFTGLTEIYREYKDFEWTYGRNKKT